MDVWHGASLVLVSTVLTACGGGGGGGDPPDACPLLGGTTLATQAQGGAAQQISIDARIMTVTSARLAEMQLAGLSFPNSAALIAGAPTQLGGSNCGPSTGVRTSVVGGAEGEAVIVPEGQAGEQTLPLIRTLPFSVVLGAQAYTNFPGPGSFGVALADRLGLGALDPIPGGQILAPQIGVPVSSLLYALTDDAGVAQFVAEAFQSVATRSVVAPRVRTRQDQTATIFVATELAPLADLDAVFAARLGGIHASIDSAEVGAVVRYTASIPASGIVSLTFEPALQAAQATRPDSFTLDGTTPSVAQVLVTRSRQVRSTVLVPDGATVILGGLRNNMTAVESTGVPLFGDLPILGTLFRSHAQLDLRDNLIILVTATIVEPD